MTARLPGVGIDLCEVDRIEAALERYPRLADRLFWPGELEQAGRARSPAKHLAARFAAKEAASKALGIRLGPRQFEVVGGGHTAPTLRLHGRARELAEAHGVELDLSLTHTKRTAAAAVIAR